MIMTARFGLSDSSERGEPQHHFGGAEAAPPQSRLIPAATRNPSRERKNFFPPFKGEGEAMASWGYSQLINYLNGELVLTGGAKVDRNAARE